MFLENAHMQKRASRKAARGGRALLTGLVRCGRCGRMMRAPGSGSCTPWSRGSSSTSTARRTRRFSSSTGLADATPRSGSQGSRPAATPSIEHAAPWRPCAASPRSGRTGREVAVALNRMQCRTGDGEAWTSVRARGLRKRLGLPECDPALRRGATVGVQKAAPPRHLRRFGPPADSGRHPARLAGHALRAVEGSGRRARQRGVLAGVRAVKDRRPENWRHLLRDEAMRLPGLQRDGCTMPRDRPFARRTAKPGCRTPVRKGRSRAATPRLLCVLARCTRRWGGTRKSWPPSLLQTGRVG